MTPSVPHLYQSPLPLSTARSPLLTSSLDLIQPFVFVNWLHRSLFIVEDCQVTVGLYSSLSVGFVGLCPSISVRRQSLLIKNFSDLCASSPDSVCSRFPSRFGCQSRPSLFILASLVVEGVVSLFVCSRHLSVFPFVPLVSSLCSSCTEQICTNFQICFCINFGQAPRSYSDLIRLFLRFGFLIHFSSL